MLCTHLTLQFNLVRILQEGGAPPFARPEYLGQVLSLQQKVSGMAFRATCRVTTCRVDLSCESRSLSREVSCGLSCGMSRGPSCDVCSGLS